MTVLFYCLNESEVITMAVPVAAIVKKVAVAILGADKETKQGIGTAIATIMVVPLLPLVVLMLAFSNGFDSDNLVSSAQSNFNVAALEYISVIDSNLSSIRSTMTASGFTEVEIKTAEDIYTLYLVSCGSQDNFVSRYVACFSSGQTAEELTCNINTTFGTSLDSGRISSIVLTLSSTYIDPGIFQDISTRNNLDLCQWAQMAYNNNWGYVWGTYGNILTKSSLASLSETYPTQVGADEFHDYIEANYIGRHCVDCAGLIKSYMWYDFDSGSFVYGSNDFADGNTEYIFTNSPDTGTIDTMPDIPGLGVYHKGHVGIYIGNGVVIEAMGTT